VANVLSKAQRLSVLHLLVEGNSVRSIGRLTGLHRKTILRILVDVGNKCRAFLDRKMRNLHLAHLELDEIWTFCLKKQGRLNEWEKDNPEIGDQYLYVALDMETKLIPSFVVGKRNKEVTEMFVDDLATRIVTPDLLTGADKPQVSTDG
jgi:hypothetical protein